MQEMTKNYEAEIDAIIQELTLEEKVNMLHGMEFFRSGGVEAKGIPCLVSSDGPMGVRNQFAGDSWFPLNISDDFVSYMPSNSAISATWNIGCAYASGQVLGEEARGRGKDVILAPGINIKRDPLCGRNFEYMSEDPCLVEEIAVPLIEGIQESDVAACVKHFAVNNQETNRLWVDTIVDERTLREIYLPGFKAAVQKANSYSLMNAYNMFEGVHCSANKRLLNDILRGEWGYDGTVISDWGSVHSTKETAEASMDLEMSITTNFDEYFFARPLVEAVNKGEVKMEDVDAKVKNILRMMYRLKMIGPDAMERKAGAYNTREHQIAIRDVARESMVLLKNEEELLPITEDRITMEAGTLAPKKKRIAVIGRNAEILHAGGGGSAEIKALYEISPLMGIKTYLGGNADVVYAPGYFIPGKKDVNEANWQETSLERQISRVDFMGETEEQQRQRVEVMTARKKLYEEAIELAKTADEVIFVGGLNHDYDVEGWDRDNMKLPYAQDDLIEALLEVNANTILVLVAGSPVEMPWRDKAKAILWCYYAGMETGHAVAEVLFGDVNPSGKLPESFPEKYEDTVTYKNGEFGKEDCVTYKEGIFYGYRYYEKEGIQTAFAFGHGLSYTKFDYLNMKVEVLPGAGVVETEEDLEKAAVRVLVEVLNAGTEYAGAEIVQCYVSDTECSVERPVKELKAFDKVYLEPEETEIVELILTNRAFAFYDVEKKAFVVEEGEFEVHVGSASDKIYHSAKINLTK